MCRTTITVSSSLSNHKRYSQISGVEVIIFLLHHNSDLYDAEKLVMMGDCCYINPMVRRTFQFLGNLYDHSQASGVNPGVAIIQPEGPHCVLELDEQAGQVVHETNSTFRRGHVSILG